MASVAPAYQQHLPNGSFSDPLRAQRDTVEDFTGFLRYLEQFPETAGDEITVDVYVQSFVQELLPCLPLGPQRKQVEERISRWEAQRLQHLKTRSQHQEQLQQVGLITSGASSSSRRNSKTGLLTDDVDDADEADIIIASDEFASAPARSSGVESDFDTLQSFATEKPGTEITSDGVDIIGIAATTTGNRSSSSASPPAVVAEVVSSSLSLQEYRKQRLLATSATSGSNMKTTAMKGSGVVHDALSTAPSTPNASSYRVDDEKKLDEAEREEMLATVANSVEQMVGIAHGIGGRLQEDNQLLDKINEDFDKRTDSLQAKNQTARDMLWSSKMGFFTQVFLFAVSVVVFFLMVSFIFATKIINW
ncbi:unnamed protein product [Amoebophrya sp. A120]|nr:unnamed protein product [Amoebophrya sp. A120]|eukprot:GSA120T00011275001.1